MFCWAGRLAACCKSGTNAGPQACRIWWMRYPFRLLPPQDNQRGPPWPPSPPVAFMAIPWGGGPALVAAPPLYTSSCCPSAHCPRESGWRPCPCGGPAPVSQVFPPDEQLANHCLLVDPSLPTRRNISSGSSPDLGTRGSLGPWGQAEGAAAVLSAAAPSWDCALGSLGPWVPCVWTQCVSQSRRYSKRPFGVFTRPWDPWVLGALGAVRGSGGGIIRCCALEGLRP